MQHDQYNLLDSKLLDYLDKLGTVTSALGLSYSLIEGVGIQAVNTEMLQMNQNKRLDEIDGVLENTYLRRTNNVDVIVFGNEDNISDLLREMRDDKINLLLRKQKDKYKGISEDEFHKMIDTSGYLAIHSNNCSTKIHVASPEYLVVLKLIGGEYHDRIDINALLTLDRLISSRISSSISSRFKREGLERKGFDFDTTEQILKRNGKGDLVKSLNCSRRDLENFFISGTNNK